MNKAEIVKQIDGFETHYKYDGTYMRELLEYSPEGYSKFDNFMPLARHREKLNPEDYWVSKLAALQVEDCGDCLQLVVRMALEEGISKSIVEAVIKGGDTLPVNLKDVYDYAKCAAAQAQMETNLMERIEARYDKGELLEFGLNIASAKVFPTIKRALGYTRSCSLVKIEV